MPLPVIDVLEIIQVDISEADRNALTGRNVEAVLDILHEGPPVGDAGHNIRPCQLLLPQDMGIQAVQGMHGQKPEAD